MCAFLALRRRLKFGFAAENLADGHWVTGFDSLHEVLAPVLDVRSTLEAKERGLLSPREIAAARKS